MAGQKNSLLDIITLHRLLSTTDRFRRHDKEHETRSQGGKRILLLLLLIYARLRYLKATEDSRG